MANHTAAPEPKHMEVLQHICTLLNHWLRSEMEGLAGPKPSSHYKDMNVHGHEYIAPTVCYGVGGNFKNAGRWYIIISIFIPLPLFTRYKLLIHTVHKVRSFEEGSFLPVSSISLGKAQFYCDGKTPGVVLTLLHDRHQVGDDTVSRTRGLYRVSHSCRPKSYSKCHCYDSTTYASEQIHF